MTTTKWEMRVVRADGAERVLGYAERRTKQCLYCAMVENGPEILEFLGDHEPDGDRDDFIAWDTRDFVWRFPRGSFVAYGQTERNAGVVGRAEMIA